MSSIQCNTLRTQFFATPSKDTTSQYIDHKLLEKINPNYTVENLTKNLSKEDRFYQQKPKIKLAGYIIGEPVAFTDQPNLPKNYLPYSQPIDNTINNKFI